MFNKLFSWLKRYGMKQAIKEMDELEKPFAELIRKAQATSGQISPDTFAKELVDTIQLKLCLWAGIDPKDVGL